MCTSLQALQGFFFFFGVCLVPHRQPSTILVAKFQYAHVAY